MDERGRQSLRKYLQREDVQERIQYNMHQGRSQATVTIGRAARIFGFTENQLRDWEEHGLLKPLRPTGQRQYTPDELNKLAIIQELINEGGYTPGEIPSDVDHLWDAILPVGELQGQAEQQGQGLKASEIEHLHLDERVNLAREELFWRYYASHVLRLTLLLICEDIPFTSAALVLPLQMKNASVFVRRTDDLPKVGESLIGWLGRSQSFYTFFDTAPSVEHHSDYRVHPLQAMEEDVLLEEDTAKDSTLIILERRAQALSLSAPVVETVRRLLAPLYEDVEDWRPYFAPGLRELTDPTTDFGSSTNSTDRLLNGLTNMVVRLGKTPDGRDRWRFCCILLPNDPLLPLQQRTLLVRAQSGHSPHKVGVTAVSPSEPIISLSLRAFQSGHIVHRSEVPDEDSTIAFYEVEGPIHSAIAIPVGGEDGQAVAILYVVSDEPDAFSEDDQRVLRMMGRIVEELLMTYRVRLQVTEKLGSLIKKPGVVDGLFGDFCSENDFIKDIETLLTSIQMRTNGRENQAIEEGDPPTHPNIHFKIRQFSEEVVTFIGVDIDNQSKLANKYGDQMMRNLGREVGLRIQEELRILFTEHVDCRLYHVYADRFYLLLKGVSLEQAREKAVKIKHILKGPYQLNALRPSIEEPTPPDSMHVLSVSVRLGVTSYPYTKLEDLLQRYSAATAVVSVRATISRDMDRALEKGRIDGGDVVVAWDPNSWEYVQLH